MSDRKSFIDPDYVDVAQRRREFFETYPDGRLVTHEVWTLDFGGQEFVCVWVKAYRTPDDPMPADGLAWEPVPGPTSFTKDSELMNAQTAAWGRAILAVGGFESKKIASADEVRNRQPSPPPAHAAAANGDEGFPVSRGATLPPKPNVGQIGRFNELLEQLELQEPRRDPTWRRMARDFANEQFDLTDAHALTAGQMQTTIVFLEAFLKAVPTRAG